MARIKDDPWALVKLMPEIAAQEKALAEARERNKGMKPEVRYTVFKCSLCGNQIRREPKHNLTMADVDAYPYGIQRDTIGDYVWSHCVTEFWHST